MEKAAALIILCSLSRIYEAGCEGAALQPSEEKAPDAACAVSDASQGKGSCCPIPQGHGGEQIPSQAPWQGGQGEKLAREPGNRAPRAGKRKQENYQDRQSGGGWMRIQTVTAKTQS